MCSRPAAAPLPLKGSEVNAQIMAKAAYASSLSGARTARATEYEIFARVTRKLTAARAAGAAGFALVAEAIHDNRRLWVALASDVAEPANGLPRDLRAQIFYLAEFTFHQSRRILSGEGDIDVLVDINTAIMKGLRGQEEQG